MKKIMLTAIAAASLTTAVATSASATCYHIGEYVSCSDGNTYNTIGNTTFGSNYNTGSFWSQTTIGNHTFGTDSDGGSWSTWNN